MRPLRSVDREALIGRTEAEQGPEMAALARTRFDEKLERGARMIQALQDNLRVHWGANGQIVEQKPDGALAVSAFTMSFSSGGQQVSIDAAGAVFGTVLAEARQSRREHVDLRA